MKTIISEERARASQTCVICSDKKAVDLVVCWHCFKNDQKLDGKVIPALKGCEMSFEEYQQRYL